ncbi:MAG: hypothetical protein IPO58_09925 [Betaproteobacteria bacterium]|nr:hypothetical protein [Betaproteobacteria bacterium]
MGEVAHGISLEVRTAGNNIEKLFQVAPGADVRGIRARIDGAGSLSLAADGGLIIATGLGAVQFTAPVAYQERGGIRTLVPVRYELAGGTGYGFATGDYDRSLPLIIDPLIRSTFSGGNGADAIRAMLVHPGSGDIYVTGSTVSTNFPGTGTGAQTTNPSGTDAFVALQRRIDEPGSRQLLRRQPDRCQRHCDTALVRRHLYRRHHFQRERPAEHDRHPERNIRRVHCPLRRSAKQRVGRALLRRQRRRRGVRAGH